MQRVRRWLGAGLTLGCGQQPSAGSFGPPPPGASPLQRGSEPSVGLSVEATTEGNVPPLAPLPALSTEGLYR